jgi:hypothetical protein
LPDDDIANFDRITHGIDRRVARAHLFVDHDAAAPADREACSLCEPRLRPHADGEDDQVGRDSGPLVRHDGEAVRVLLYRLKPLTDS